MNVVFIHGWACGWQDWTSVTSLLPVNVKVGLAKLPGSPGAFPLEGAISLNDCAAHVLSEADNLDFDNFALVGHSMGARIALELAANWPRRVSRLLLIDGSNVPEDPDQATSRLAGQLEQFGRRGCAETAIESMMVNNLDPDQRWHLVTRVAQHPTNTLLAYYYAMAAWDQGDFIPALDRITCPVTVLQSTSLDEHETRRSVIAHPSSNWLDVIRARVSLAEIRLVPDVGHFVMLECPQMVASWIQKIPQTDRGDHCGSFGQKTKQKSRWNLT
ncbi:alpha/beta fold hydrolase [Ruegeria hyattellae]|uniref:alpha/beta fold hydrolase n=1 Tax=Ruegeria hyattellae TaxID=3233337 RepID=UPI00355AEB3D